MNLDILFMNGYGIYVWSAFAFSFILCLGLFLRTKKVLKKLENEFKAEANHLSSVQMETLKTHKVAKEILTSQSKAL